MTGKQERKQGQGDLRSSSPPSALEFLLPVWGPRHIGSFLDFGLPTLLAPGNLPRLSKLLPCSFVVLTRRAEAPIFLRHPACRRLGELCKLDVQAIDDLIIEGHHSVTLTLAYERAMRACGSAMRDTCFFFLVADFLVADGTLTRVYDRICIGARGVLGGNFQIKAEAAAADLRPLVNSHQELVLTPRKLMALALKHLHPMTLAKLVNIPLCHDPLANRLFWRVDEHTLLGHFFLLHMIAIRPEVTNFSISAPCDYSFIPELCPSGNVAVMADSDESLIVEMQPRRHEVQRVRPGAFDIAALGRSLTSWTTAQHRVNARGTLTFHAGELPPAAASVAGQAQRFIAELERYFTAPPKSHRHQSYWASAIAEWPNAGSRPSGLTQHTARARVRALSSWRAALFGRVPDLRPWHPRWPDFQQLRSLLEDAFPKSDRLLIVASSARFTSWVAQAGWMVESREVDYYLAGQVFPASSAPPFAGALLLVDAESTNIFAALSEIEKLVSPNSPLVVMVTNGLLDDVPRAVSSDWLAEASSLLASASRIERCVVVYRRQSDTGLQNTFVNLLRAGYHNPVRRGFSGLLSILLLPISLISNLLTIRRRTLPFAGFWSSLIIVMRADANSISEDGLRPAGPHPDVSASDCGTNASMQAAKRPPQSMGGLR